MQDSQAIRGSRGVDGGRAITATAVVLASLAAMPVQGQCQYSVQGQPPKQCSFAFSVYTGTGLNNLGAWCGYRLTCYPEEGDSKLAIYCSPGGTPQILPTPPGTTAPYGVEARAVNDAGVVVGYSRQGPSGSNEIGCIWWPNGTIQEIPPAPGGTNSPAYDINNGNIIVGGSIGMPYVFDGNVMTIIPVPPEHGGGSAWRISDTGYVTGTFGNENLNARAYRWKDGVLTLLEPLPGYPVSASRDVDNNGNVVGYSKIGHYPNPVTQTPTLWTQNEVIELPLPPGYTAGAASMITDQGIITGQVGGLPGQGIPVTVAIWFNGEPYLLNDFTLPGSPNIGSIIRCNSKGQLLQGGGVRILTPTGDSIADLNGDCAVDGADLMLLLGEWGPREASPADINTDGVVDGADLAIVLGSWSPS